MLTRSIVCVGLTTLILLMSITTTESKRHRGRGRKDDVRSRNDDKDDEIVKGEGGMKVRNGQLPSAAAAGSTAGDTAGDAGSVSEDRRDVPKCEGCYLSPSVRIKVSRSRGPGSRRHRSRHRGRHRSRSHQGRSGRKQDPKRPESLEGRPSHGQNGAKRRPPDKQHRGKAEGAPSSSEASLELEDVSESPPSSHEGQKSHDSQVSDSGRSSRRGKKMDNPRSRQRERQNQQPEQQSRQPGQRTEQPTEQAVADQGLPRPPSPPQPGSDSEPKSKKKSRKGRKGRRKSQKDESSGKKETTKDTKEKSKDKDKSESSSFWSWFGFSSSEDSSDSDASKEKSDKEDHEEEESEEAQHQSEQDIDQEAEQSNSRQDSDKTPTRHRGKAQNIRDNDKLRNSDSTSDSESEGKPEGRKGRRKDKLRTQGAQGVARRHKGRKSSRRRNRKRGDKSDHKGERKDDGDSKPEKEDSKSKPEKEDSSKSKPEKGEDSKSKPDKGEDSKSKGQRGDDNKPKRTNEDDVKLNLEPGDDVKPKQQRKDDVKASQQHSDKAELQRKRGHKANSESEIEDNAKSKSRKHDGDVKSQRNRGDDVKSREESKDDVSSDEENKNVRKPDRNDQDSKATSPEQLPDALKRHRHGQAAARRNRQRQRGRRRHRKHPTSGRRERKHPRRGSDSHDDDAVDKDEHHQSARHHNEDKDADREHKRRKEEHQDEVIRDKEGQGAKVADKEEKGEEGDESDNKNAEKRGRKHHRSGKRHREHVRARERDREQSGASESEPSDDVQEVKGKQEAADSDRFQLIGNLKRRRQDGVGRAPQNSNDRNSSLAQSGRRDGERQRNTRRDKERQKDARRDRSRQEDARRDREHQDARRDREHQDARRDREHQDAARHDRRRQHDVGRRGRARQSDMRHGRQWHDGSRRDRYHAYDVRRYGPSRMEERREMERQRATRHEMERRIAARQEMERQMMVKRHRERQIAAHKERERLMAMRREREREIAARRERERLAFNRRRDRERAHGRGRGRGRDREGRPMELHQYGRHYVDPRPASYNYPSRPAAADRLERRLSPSVHSHTRSLLHSLQRTLSTLVGGLQAVKNVNDFVFNGTRYTIMMGVRKQLKEIAEANNMAYDTILRATLLTKDIYMRAHQHRFTGPSTRSLDRPEMSLPSLYDVIRAAYDEERKAQEALRSVQEFVRGRQSVTARLQQVRERFQDNFARNDLRTLVYYVNSTVQKLGQELTTSSHVAYLRRNTAMLTNSRGNLTVARDLIYKASDILAKGTEDYRGNYRVVQDWRRLRQDERGVGPPVSIRRRARSALLRHSRPVRDITPAERARLRPIIDRAKKHAREQERLALQAERLLRPVIRHGKDAISRKDDAAVSAWLSSLVTRVHKDAKKMFSLLDSIRVIIGAKQELRWAFSMASACAEEGDDVEGSGCDGEGSGDLILEGAEEGSGEVPGVPADDEDFVFVDETGPPKRGHPPSLEEFGERLSVYLDGVQLRSRDVMERGDHLFEKTEKLSKKWSDTKKSYDAADRARRLWKQSKEVMENVTSYVDDISQVTVTFSDRVNRSFHSIQTRAARAVEIAEQRLAEAEANKEGGGGGGGKEEDDMEKDADGGDDTIVVQAVEKAENVRREMGNVRSLRQVTPQSCGRASGQLVRLHANISHLRQQITTAKALLQTMQLAISKSGSGYLSIPASEKALAPSSPRTRSRVSTPSLPTTVSMVTMVEVCIKTQDEDGPVLLVKGNNSASFSLSVSDQEITVTVYDAKGYKLDSVTSDVTMTEDKWYKVKVIRTGHRVVLRVEPRDGTDPPVDSSVTIASMTPLQPSPVHVYVGGVAEEEPFSVGSDSWRGCLSELRVDGRAVPLFRSTSTGELPQLCSSQCASMDDGQALVFNGAGYLHFPSSVLPMRRRMKSIHFRFRTRQPSAALLHVVNQRMRFLLRVMLNNGALVIDTTTPSESITLLSRARNYTDGAFHSLKIMYQDSTTYPVIDGRDGGFTIERSRPQDLNKMAEGVMIGGFVSGNLQFEKSKFRPLIGCLQELEIDDKPLSMTQAATSVGVFTGSCDSQSLWSECVQFGQKSTGVDLGSMDKSGTVLLLFSWDARGPLLTYSREGKFETEVEATEEGLQVTKEEEELSISRPDDAADHFILLTITDDGVHVTYSAWGEEVKFKYGGFWYNQADVDGEHQVQIAAPLDASSDRRLFGQIAQVMVGQRYIALANHTDSSSLEACQRPVPDLVMEDTPPEVTASPKDEEETCSKDIQC